MRHARSTILLAAMAMIGAPQATAAATAAPAAAGSILSWTPEQQAYGFGHIESLVPTRTVRRGTTVRA